MKFNFENLCAAIGKAILSRTGKKASLKHIVPLENYFKKEKVSVQTQRLVLIHMLIKSTENLSEEDKEISVDDCIEEMIKYLSSIEEEGEEDVESFTLLNTPPAPSSMYL
ncbi:MAG: hypothetical protein KAX49_11740 [Halanaerobiales bacterium]|nr:hypothetical protein [Halanaerobiales bacterium]